MVRKCMKCRVMKPNEEFKTATSTNCMPCATSKCAYMAMKRAIRNANETPDDRKARLARELANADATRTWYSGMLRSNRKRDKTRFPNCKFVEGEHLESLRAKYGGRCWYCDVRMTFYKRSGNTQVTLERKNNDIGHTTDNVVLACRKCNMTRGARYSYRDWRDRFINYEFDIHSLYATEVETDSYTS